VKLFQTSRNYALCLVASAVVGCWNCEAKAQAVEEAGSSTQSTTPTVPQLVVGSFPAPKQALKLVEVPAGEAQSAVSVVTEYRGEVVAAETGFVIHSDDSRTLVFVVARFSPSALLGKPSERRAFAIVGHGKDERRVALEKTWEMSKGATLYSAKKSELSTPLSRKTDVAVNEGMSLLLVGCNVDFVDDRAVPKIVATKVKVDRVVRDSKAVAELYSVEAEVPLNVRTCLLVTPEGKAVGHGMFDPKRPRSTSGYRYFECRSMDDLTHVGDPEVTFLCASFKVSGGTARIEFAMMADDPFARLKKPRLLVSTKLREGKSLAGHSLSDKYVRQLFDEAGVTIRDGVWVDKSPGDFEVALSPVAKVDPAFGKFVSIPQQGSAFAGQCTFPLIQSVPFAVQCVVDDGEGRIKTLGTADCVQLNAEAEALGCSLLKQASGIPVNYGR